MFPRFIAASVLFLLPALLAQALFTEVGTEAGFIHPQTRDPALFPESDIIFYSRGGIAVADFDGDGWEDVFLTRHYLPAILYRNNGDGTFSDATAQAGLPTAFQYHSMGAAFGDLDNDGDPDLVVTTTRGSTFTSTGVGCLPRRPSPVEPT